MVINDNETKKNGLQDKYWKFLLCFIAIFSVSYKTNIDFNLDVHIHV